MSNPGFTVSIKGKRSAKETAAAQLPRTSKDQNVHIKNSQTHTYIPHTERHKNVNKHTRTNRQAQPNINKETHKHKNTNTKTHKQKDAEKKKTETKKN
jgi:hypothetical protein